MARGEASIAGPRGTVRCDWATAAVLRDNVMHWIEGGAPTGSFPTIHQLAERASSDDLSPVDATALLAELDRALPLLRTVKGAHVAVGIRTRARMTGTRELPSVRGTMLARLSGWSPPLTVRPEASLESVFEHLHGLVRHVADAPPTGRFRL